MHWVEGEYLISNDKSMLSLDRVHELLSQSYWADKRPKDKIEASIRNSICYGIYHHGKQVGFGRVVTDYATMYWVCDIFIDKEHRGKGLGKKLVKCIIETEQLKGLFGILSTKDAHGLYEKFGFKRVPDKVMRRDP
ncbi:MAG: GNAT family N-acetyltransferase [Firmicutes bacterium]|nr:GNAT family N-acetyltransferase [Bacillota bacterium]